MPGPPVATGTDGQSTAAVRARDDNALADCMTPVATTPSEATSLGDATASSRFGAALATGSVLNGNACP